MDSSTTQKKWDVIYPWLLGLKVVLPKHWSSTFDAATVKPHDFGQILTQLADRIYPDEHVVIQSKFTQLPTYTLFEYDCLERMHRYLMVLNLMKRGSRIGSGRPQSWTPKENEVWIVAAMMTDLTVQSVWDLLGAQKLDDVSVMIMLVIHGLDPQLLGAAIDRIRSTSPK
jgi:hypothetical protein